jgi:RNA polymerase sigma factor (sigma-70 family)
MSAARINPEAERLPERMVALEDRAYQEFADHFGPRFRALFLHCGLVASDAEDLAVSCITDIALKVGRYRRSEGNFEAWVFLLARRALVDWWRRHRPTQPLLEDLSAEESAAPDPDLLQSVREALAKLSEDDQTIICLRDFGTEHSYAEIAQRLGIQTGAARTRHLRALQRLESLLGQDARVRSFLDSPRGRERGRGDEA